MKPEQAPSQEPDSREPGPGEPDYRRRARIWMRIAAAALPAGLVTGIAAGIALGVPAIGAAIGAGLGFGLTVVSFAAAFVMRAADPRL